MAPTGDRLDAAVKVGSIVSSLGGFAALAALTGGAITWTRFHGVQLPADQAVAAIPKIELVTIGAVTLATFAVISLVSVLLVYLVDREGRPELANQRGIGLLAIVAVVAAVLLSRPDGYFRIAIAILIALIGGLVVYRAALRGWRKSPGVVGAGALATKYAVLPAVVFAAALLPLTKWWVVVMALLTVALAGLALHVAHRTGSKFRWYGAAIFTAILVYGSALSTLRTYADPKVQPVAVVLTQAAGAAELSGLYIAGSPNQVYVADVEHCIRDKQLRLKPTAKGRAGRLIEVPRGSIAALAIGNLASVEDAKQRGPQLLGELRERLASSTTTRAAAATRAAPDPCASEGIVDLSLRAFNDLAAPEAERLAKQFRPILRFDSGEQWRPLRIEALLAERTARGAPSHRVCILKQRKQDGCEALGSVADIGAATTGSRLIDFAGKRFGGVDHRSPDLESCPGYRPADTLRDCDRGAASAIYYRATRANGRTYVDYWWFLRYNRFAHKSAENLCKDRFERAVLGCFDHEGDWEGVTVVTARGRPDELASVGFASHSGVYRHPAADIKRIGLRPVVYVAQGSHAAYRKACPARCAQPAKKYGHSLPETSTDGARGWGRNSDEACFGSGADCLQPLPVAGWNAFDGRWGSRECKPKGCEIELGPLTPSNQHRYKVPWCATGPGNQLVCDGAPPAPGSTTAVGKTVPPPAAPVDVVTTPATPG